MEHYSAQKKEGNLETCSNGDGWPLRTARKHTEPDPEGRTASESALTRQLQKVGNPRALAKGLWREELNILIGCREEPRRSMMVMEEKRSTTDSRGGGLKPQACILSYFGGPKSGQDRLFIDSGRIRPCGSLPSGNY